MSTVVCRLRTRLIWSAARAERILNQPVAFDETAKTPIEIFSQFFFFFYTLCGIVSKQTDFSYNSLTIEITFIENFFLLRFFFCITDILQKISTVY